MALRITSKTFVTNRSLEVDSAGVTYREATAFSNVRKFGFAQIEAILMAPDHTLSFQVGREVFSIPTSPHDKSHQQTIESLLQEVRRSA